MATCFAPPSSSRWRFTGPELQLMVFTSFSGNTCMWLYGNVRNMASVSSIHCHGNAATVKVHQCGTSSLRVTFEPRGPPTPPPLPSHFLLGCCSAAALPAKAKWDHNYDVSAAKTACRVLQSNCSHGRPAPPPLRCFERPRLVSGESPAVCIGVGLPAAP